MCYYSFLIKKAAALEVFDLTYFIITGHKGTPSAWAAGRPSSDQGVNGQNAECYFRTNSSLKNPINRFRIVE
ncbi:hypothetical protein TUM17577_29500 [Enterobacter asburiae]|nr:hypothetical protein TUM17577_29500 [Enterobacter asburiae]